MAAILSRWGGGGGGGGGGGELSDQSERTGTLSSSEAGFRR